MEKHQCVKRSLGSAATEKYTFKATFYFNPPIKYLHAVYKHLLSLNPPLGTYKWRPMYKQIINDNIVKTGAII